MKLDEHPTVTKYRTTSRKGGYGRSDSTPLKTDWLRTLCLEAGADDVGFIEIDRPEIANQRDEIQYVFPKTKTLISYVVRMNREPIRTPARSIANLEFHHTSDEVNDIGRRIVRVLEEHGVGALNPSSGFPMEVEHFPGKTWLISHKPVAVAAGLGQMGIHRNVIHPQFGNFILLGAVLIDRAVTETQQPIDFNPCFECKLCVAACPVGAIKADGQFDFAACFTHNYREFMGGFNEWAEQLADSRNAADYLDKFNESETASMWQSLSFGANYKAAYCLAVCPAGEDVIGTFLENRKTHLNDVVKPLQQKVEPIYVVKGSDAEAHVKKRFGHKEVRHVRNMLRPTSVAALLRNLPLVFQANQAEDLDAVYHFTFTGEETARATIIIREQGVTVREGHHETPDLAVQADSATWLKIVRGEEQAAWALIKRQIRLKGPLKLLLAFGRCFPS